MHLHFKDVGRSSSQPGCTMRPPSSTGRRGCTRAKAADRGRPAARTARAPEGTCLSWHPGPPAPLANCTSHQGPPPPHRHTRRQPSPSEPAFRPKAEGFDIRETLRTAPTLPRRPAAPPGGSPKAPTVRQAQSQHERESASPGLPGFGERAPAETREPPAPRTGRRRAATRAHPEPRTGGLQRQGLLGP